MTLRALLLGLAVAGGAALPLAGGLDGGSARAQTPAGIPAETPAVPTSLEPAQARVAAERVLTTLQRGDANARFQQFTAELQQMTSPSMVAATMRRQPKLLSWKILDVRRGLRHSVVEVELTTSAGRRDLLLVLDGQGKLAGYHFETADQPATEVARSFVRALADGQFISARSFLSLDTQRELSPAALQSKWLGLQRLTGNFVRVRQVVLSETTADQKLVLVTTEFNRLTDSLFVILNTSNQIIGVDFPNEPDAPRGSR